uniref:TNFR-Cys domain-containing protein n=1 Tax=Nothobranchius furzeri TaxID=105023 RepID=A0A8C6KY91_NOTFU
MTLICVFCFATDPATTYSHQDPTTGETLLCGSCQPGTHRVAHCTATTPTQCAPCRENHFTALWNYLPRCLYCNHICIQNQEVETECSPVSNRVCRCKPGYYLMDDFCDKHSECGLGYGVQTAGTHQKDTVCEKCPSGYFSNSSSQLDSCMKHQECGNGQLVLLAGSAYHDTVCGLLTSLQDGVIVLIP